MTHTGKEGGMPITLFVQFIDIRSSAEMPWAADLAIISRSSAVCLIKASRSLSVRIGVHMELVKAVKSGLGLLASGFVEFAHNTVLLTTELGFSNDRDRLRSKIQS